MHDHSSSRIQLPPELMGSAVPVRQAADLARRASQSDEPVLIVAEPGFSPEGIARAIHRSGPRSARPFVAAKPSRADDETVGRDGALSRVGAGTIFFSGIGDMPAAVQVRLSRLLRDGEMRVGKSPVRVRFRLMASAVPELEGDVREHRFRPELYRRLQRLRVDVPPLRDRAGDLPELIDVVLSEICRRSGISCQLAPAARTALAALRWGGNLEEVREVLRRLVDQCPDGLIRQEDVLADLQEPQGRLRPQPAPASLRDARQTFERQYISTVLEEYGWRMTAAARVLGIERANLYRKKIGRASCRERV